MLYLYSYFLPDIFAHLSNPLVLAFVLQDDAAILELKLRQPSSLLQHELDTHDCTIVTTATSCISW